MARTTIPLIELLGEECYREYKAALDASHERAMQKHRDETLAAAKALREPLYFD